MTDALLAVAHIDIILNGHQIQGPADEDKPYDLVDDGDLIDTKDGPDGAFYGTSRPRLGGDLTLMLQPTSPSTRWLINQRIARDTAIENGSPLTEINGTYEDAAQGRSFVLTGGQLVTCPKGVHPGVTYQATIRFQRIVANFDAASMTGSAQTQ